MFQKFVSLGEFSKLSHKDKTVVMTTGVFDVPHVGHPRYLYTARMLGDLLVVGVHSDELVRQRKGEGRPIYPLEERVELLSYYGCVDFILELKDQEDVYGTIRTVRPKILVVSTTTEDEANSPATMSSMFGDSMAVAVLGPQSFRHTTDLVEKQEVIEK
ncbi:MAG: adenylyltransferase/cytidyltransferase family protein [Candidatus Paceibacterota bacterium]